MRDRGGIMSPQRNPCPDVPASMSAANVNLPIRVWLLHGISIFMSTAIEKPAVRAL